MNMKKIIAMALMAMIAVAMHAQLPKVYDESIDPMAQIDEALTTASAEGKNVICQVGGNWCIWCLRFADFVAKDEDASKLIADNYVYIHVNYPRNGAAENLLKRLGNPGRFGYPAIVVLDKDGRVIHIQDSSFLEEGKGYSHDKVVRFLKNWTPASVNSNN